MAPRRRSLNAKYDSVARTHRVRPLSLLVGGGGGGGAQNLAARQKRAEERAAFLQRLGIDQAQLVPKHNNNNSSSSRTPLSFNALQNRFSGHNGQGTRSTYPVYEPQTADCENRPEQWVLDIMYPHEACPPAPEPTVSVPQQQQAAQPVFLPPQSQVAHVPTFATMWPRRPGTTTTTTPASNPYVPLWLTPHGVVDMAGRPLHLPPRPTFAAPHAYFPELGDSDRDTPSPPHRHTKRSRYAAYSPDFDDYDECYDERYGDRYYSLLKRRRRPRYSPTESELDEEEYRRRRMRRRRLEQLIHEEAERALDTNEGAFIEEVDNVKSEERRSAQAAFLKDVTGVDETGWRNGPVPSFEEDTHNAPLSNVAAHSASPFASPTPPPTPPSRPHTLPDPTTPANSTGEHEYVDDRSGIRGARLVNSLERAAEDWSHGPADDEAGYEVGGSARRQQKVEVSLPTPPTSSLPPSSASRPTPKSARHVQPPNSPAEHTPHNPVRQKQAADRCSNDDAWARTPSSTLATPGRLHRASERAWTAFEGIRTVPAGYERGQDQRTPSAYDEENAEAPEGDGGGGDYAYPDADGEHERDDAESIAQFSDEAYDDRGFWDAASALDCRADTHASEGQDEIEPAHPLTPTPPPMPQFQAPAPKARKKVHFDLEWEIGAEGDGYPGFRIWRDGWD